MAGEYFSANPPQKIPLLAHFTMSLEGCKLGFIGAGKMACAIIRGLIRASVISPENISASSPSGTNFPGLSALGVCVTHSNVEVVQRSTVLILAVKPQVVGGVLLETRSRLTPAHLVVSLVAGVSTSQVAEALGGTPRVVRVMPNVPCEVGCSATSLSGGVYATRKDVELVLSLFHSVGTVEVVPERCMDAATGVAGSGAAFAFIFLEAMADGAVASGMPRTEANRLAAQTLMGAAKMVLETGRHPAALKDSVCSPAGTTIAGVQKLEDGSFRGTVMQAVTAASKRAADISSSYAIARAAAAPPIPSAIPPAPIALSPVSRALSVVGSTVTDVTTSNPTSAAPAVPVTVPGVSAAPISVPAVEIARHSREEEDHN